MRKSFGDIGEKFTVDQSKVMSLVERSVDGENFVLPAYACTLELLKELRWSRLYCLMPLSNGLAIVTSCYAL